VCVAVMQCSAVLLCVCSGGAVQYSASVCVAVVWCTAVHCFCMCSGGAVQCSASVCVAVMQCSAVLLCMCSSDALALLGDMLGVSRSVERDSLVFLSFYPRIFLNVLFVSMCFCVFVVLV